MPYRRFRRAIGAVLGLMLWTSAATADVATAETVPALAGPLHTTGTDSQNYDRNNLPVRLLGFNWVALIAVAETIIPKPRTPAVWYATPADPIINGVAFNDFYSNIRAWGYNTVRLPISWHNLEPVPPVWSPSLNRYQHTFALRMSRI